MTDDIIINMRGARVALGPVRNDLLSLYTRWINDFTVVRTKNDAPLPVTEEAYAAVVAQATTGAEKAWFTLYEMQGLRPVGVCGLFDIDFRHSTAEYGIHIGVADARGRGLGSAATHLMLDYAFTALGLHNVVLRVFADNHAGRRAYASAGFREFGVREQSWRMGSTLRDVVYMQCLSTWFERSDLAQVFAPDTPRA
jgi:diamine N-acetyltransferase